MPIKPCAAKAVSLTFFIPWRWPVSAWKKLALGVRSTICSLLHDTVEDTDITLDDVQREFGSEIAKIVDGLTKISNIVDVNASQQAENFRKIF
jgi:guanosine-3',5'-bis(diphosphate) 3'-pyrophosphohydrolase